MALLRALVLTFVCAVPQESKSAPPHPWKDFPEGAKVTRETSLEQGGGAPSKEEVTYIRGAVTEAGVELAIRRGETDGGVELAPLSTTEDGLTDVKSVSSRKDKLKIGAENLDVEIEELTANAHKGTWKFKIWVTEKVRVSAAVLQGLAIVPAKKLGQSILKVEAYYDSGDGEPDYAKYDVVALDEKVRVGAREVTAMRIKVDRRMERVRFETTEAVLSLDVPGHLVRSSVTLKGGRGPGMKSSVETKSFEVPAPKKSEDIAITATRYAKSRVDCTIAWKEGKAVITRRLETDDKVTEWTGTCEAKDIEALVKSLTDGGAFDLKSVRCSKNCGVREPDKHCPSRAELDVKGRKGSLDTCPTDETKDNKAALAVIDAIFAFAQKHAIKEVKK